MLEDARRGVRGDAAIAGLRREPTGADCRACARSTDGIAGGDAPRASTADAPRRPRLRHLHVGLDRQAEGRRRSRTARVVNFLLRMAREPGLDGGGRCSRSRRSPSTSPASSSPAARCRRARVVDRRPATTAARRRAARCALLERRGATVACRHARDLAPAARGGLARHAALKVLCGGEALPRDWPTRCSRAAASCGTCTARPRRRSGRPCARRRADASGPDHRSAARSPTPRSTSSTRPAAASRSASPGELYIGGDGRGARLPEPARAHRRALRPRPLPAPPGARLYRTGDLRALARPTASSSSSGRIDHQVKVRGFRIELGEIEARSRGTPACAQRGASRARTRRRHAPRRLRRAAGGDGPVDRASCAPSCSDSCPSYMVPRAFVVLDALPLTRTARSTARRCRARRRAGRAGARYVGAAHADRGRCWPPIWASVLGADASASHDNFFALGGHSLLARASSRAPRAGSTCAGAVRARRWPSRASSPSPRRRRRAPRALRAGDARRASASRDAMPDRRARRASSALVRAGAPVVPRPARPGERDVQRPARRCACAARSTAARSSGRLARVVRRHEVLRTTFGRATAAPVQVVLAATRAAAAASADLTRLPHARQREVARARPRRASRARPSISRGRPLSARGSSGSTTSEHVLALHDAPHRLRRLVARRADARARRALRRRFAAGRAVAAARAADAVRRLRGVAARVARRATRSTRAARATGRSGSPARRRRSSCPPTGPRPRGADRRGGAMRVRARLPLGRASAAAARARRARGRDALHGRCSRPSTVLLHRYTGQTTSSSARPIAGRDRAGAGGADRLLRQHARAARCASTPQPASASCSRRARDGLGAYAHQDCRSSGSWRSSPRARPQPHPAVPGRCSSCRTRRRRARRASPGLDDRRIARQRGDRQVRPRRSGSSTSPTDALRARSSTTPTSSTPRPSSGCASTTRRLLAAASPRPDAAVSSSLPILTADGAARQLLVDVERDRAACAGDAAVHELVRGAGGTRADAVGGRVRRRALTYGELDARANRLAHHLRALRRRPGDARRPVRRALARRWSSALLGDPQGRRRLRAARPRTTRPIALAYMLEDAGVAGCSSPRRGSLAAGWPGRPARCCVLLDDVGSRAGRRAGDGPAPTATPRPEDLAYVIYTSGSTGRPKGVQVHAPRRRELPRGRCGASPGSHRPATSCSPSRRCRSTSPASSSACRSVVGGARRARDARRAADGARALPTLLARAAVPR